MYLSRCRRVIEERCPVPSDRVLSIGCPATEPEHAEPWEKPCPPNKLPHPGPAEVQNPVREVAVTSACTKTFQARAPTTPALFLT